MSRKLLYSIIQAFSMLSKGSARFTGTMWITGPTGTTHYLRSISKIVVIVVGFMVVVSYSSQ